MERVARLKLGANLVFRQLAPFRRKPVTMIEDPTGELPGNRTPHTVTPAFLEQPPPHDLADFGRIVDHKVFAHAPDHFGQLVLPLPQIIGHFRRRSGQAEQADRTFRRRERHGQVLHERMELVRLFRVPARCSSAFRRTESSTGLPTNRSSSPMAFVPGAVLLNKARPFSPANWSAKSIHGVSRPGEASHELPTKMATLASGISFSPVAFIMSATPEKSFAAAPVLHRW